MYIEIEALSLAISAYPARWCRPPIPPPPPPSPPPPSPPPPSPPPPPPNWTHRCSYWNWFIHNYQSSHWSQVASSIRMVQTCISRFIPKIVMPLSNVRVKHSFLGGLAQCNVGDALIINVIQLAQLPSGHTACSNKHILWLFSKLRQRRAPWQHICRMSIIRVEGTYQSLQLSLLNCMLHAKKETTCNHSVFVIVYLP